MRHIEQAALGTILNHPEAWTYQPTAELFTGYEREVFEAAQALRNEGRLVDAFTVSERLVDEGAHNALQAAAESVGSLATFREHLDHLWADYRERRARQIGAALAEHGNPQEARDALDALDEQRTDSNTLTAAEAKRAFWDDLAKGDGGLSTGIRDLDRRLGAIWPGDLWIVGGRPSMGKTALVLNILEHQREPVAIFSLETKAAKIVRRLIASKGFDMGKLTRPKTITEAEYARLSELTQRVSDHLFINDTGGMSINQIESEARRLVKHRGVKMLALDYLQLVRCRAESRFQEVSEVSRRLQALAKNLNVPILAVSQLNRSSEGSVSKRPALSDLRESGQIEQDADGVILVHRPEYYRSDDRPGEADLIVAKSKDGETGDVPVHWDGARQRFSTLANQWRAA